MRTVTLNGKVCCNHLLRGKANIYAGALQAPLPGAYPSFQRLQTALRIHDQREICTRRLRNLSLPRISMEWK